MSRQSITDKGGSGIQPPQPAKVEPKKEFQQGKWYKCIDNCAATGNLTEGKFYKCKGLNGSFLIIDSDIVRDSSGWSVGRFDINSESNYNPGTEDPYKHTAYVKFKKGSCGEYSSKEYCYKCDDAVLSEHIKQLTMEKVYASVDVHGEILTVQIQRIIKDYVDPEATKCIIGIVKSLDRLDIPDPCTLPAITREHRKVSPFFATNSTTVSGYDVSLSDVVKVTINRDDLSGKLMTDYLTTKEESNMSTNNYRKTVTVNLIDRDSALDEKFALVATFGEFTTSKSSEALIRSIIIDPKNKVAELIAQHNGVRVKQTNKEIMERTGNKVTLEPVEESDLHWEIR